MQRLLVYCRDHLEKAQDDIDQGVRPRSRVSRLVLDSVLRRTENYVNIIISMHATKHTQRQLRLSSFK